MFNQGDQEDSDQFAQAQAFGQYQTQQGGFSMRSGNPVLDGVSRPIIALALLAMGAVFLMKDIDFGSRFFAAAPSFMSKRTDVFWDKDELWWVMAAIAIFQVLYWAGWLNWELGQDTDTEKWARRMLVTLIWINIFSNVVISINGYTPKEQVPYLLETFGAYTVGVIWTLITTGNIWPMVAWIWGAILGACYSVLPEMFIGAAIQLLFGRRPLS